MSTNDEDLIWGVITPLRFMQVASLLPAFTLIGFYIESLQWLGISFGLAGTALFGIIVGKGVLGKRKLPNQLWVLLLVQVIATAWVLADWRGLV